VWNSGSESEVGWRREREKSEHNPKVAKVPKKWRKFCKSGESSEIEKKKLT
jgi:hypothetical protein